MTDLIIDDALVRWSVPQDERAEALRTRPLLVMMHGYGSFEGDLINLQNFLPKHFVLASPRAPLIAPPPVVDGFAWFQMEDPGNPSPEDGERAVTALLGWLDRVAGTVEGGLSRVSLLGFSQGGAMATHALRTQPERFISVVNCSGFIIDCDMPGDKTLKTTRPPVFWGRDVDDPIITPNAISRTEDWIPGHSTPTIQLYPGVGHSISEQELRDINHFLNRLCPD
ncbi:alpha/beta hydrolase-fold protein [Lysinibacter sp. HNR]|uniref:alpha/beta hydrolase n=1 Tax=Lysinibacter sp. HNR TaxID=3031408 RepID=UPI002435E7E1|nr:alpha/beta hydrolase-fold protein [Lysinibacter sp. HNR]WGD36776.1 alpha/beta hydrolase-fold protein [Lysinibacter sp. HNR]